MYNILKLIYYLNKLYIHKIIIIYYKFIDIFYININYYIKYKILLIIRNN